MFQDRLDKSNIVFMKTSHSHVTLFFYKADLVSSLVECTSNLEENYILKLILYGHLRYKFIEYRRSLFFLS